MDTFNLKVETKSAYYYLINSMWCYNTYSFKSTTYQTNPIRMVAEIVSECVKYIKSSVVLKNND